MNKQERKFRCMEEFTLTDMKNSMTFRKGIIVKVNKTWLWNKETNNGGIEIENENGVKYEIEAVYFHRYFQEITPAEDYLRKAVNILDEKFVGDFGYILTNKLFYKDNWLKNNICAKQYEISETSDEIGYNIDSECCEICKKANNVPSKEKYDYLYGYYLSEEDTEPEIYLSEKEYDILKTLEKENENSKK